MSSEPVCILGIGTAVPGSIFPRDEFIALQKEAAEFAISELDENIPEEKKRIDQIRINCDWVVRCAQNSGIDKRHGIVPEEGEKIQDYYRKYDFNPPYNLRARYWRKYCPDLTMEAVRKCLDVWGGDKDQITHVVSHSTTGWDVPGLSHHVMYNLNLPESARAIPVNYVGCQGGTSVLYVATQIAKQDPNAVVLALAAEIQSPLGRMYNDDISLERSIYMPNVLFGDAAGCAIIGRPHTASPSSTFPAFELGDMYAHYIKNTRHVLTIGVSNEPGLYYENSIKKELPVHLNSALSKNFGTWLKKTVNKPAKDVAFAVHPGGRLLLDNFSQLLEAYGVKSGKEYCQYSYKNLREYGNLASAAILFILNDVLLNTDKDHLYFMAMGPGVCLEYGGGRRYRPGARPKTKSNQSGASNSTIFFLLTIIVALLGLMIAGFTFNDIQSWL